ncbi:MAG: hypothetical protein CM15mP2_3210 [Methanobacteriota archaeon]|nr:MAG: hypothetical protein CM15mP2_3210 [Euryarchaeota archaeon]
MHMVDWNLDADGYVSGHDNTPTPMLVKQPSRRGPFGLRKSRPLVEGSQHYITHSGKKAEVTDKNTKGKARLRWPSD